MKSLSRLMVIASAIPFVVANALAADCNDLLKLGVFDTRNTNTASANRQRLALAFCKEEASSLQVAKKAGGAVGIDLFEVLKAQGGGGAEESQYQTFRARLCHKSAYEADETFFLKEEVKTASKAIVDGFNQCIANKGLVQYLTTNDKSDKFVWNIVFRTPDNRIPTVDVFLDERPKGRCTYQNRPAPQKISGVGVGGVRLNCSLKPTDDDALYTLTATSEPIPPAIFFNRKNQELRGPQIFVAQTDMKQAFSHAFPPGFKCRLLSATGYFDHGNGQKGLCPKHGMEIGEGDARFDFDPGHYTDNKGDCTYTFACDPSSVKAAIGASDKQSRK